MDRQATNLCMAMISEFSIVYSTTKTKTLRLWESGWESKRLGWGAGIVTKGRNV
ncbi:hypothetical protein HYDPIDRAFT_114657 [Hydnomerulius pinastri MD-312]|uniref:Unplaced genomic scaffold scaffold_22, whole genome shotgun sequence n=1 Tax=Hydnomerulius pinastri MD-312 TaxID=994086 RepID=A0A0C9W615_9AGAM|nr:hypothetical protein HYDPIDRAFT_116868 [Hydnomerulius pinastri MD-312]KIJ62208.1 hypothetical protein HYDPIDRAFT_114657 [Hydnomerulius pinastri MD-312]